MWVGEKRNICYIWKNVVFKVVYLILKDKNIIDSIYFYSYDNNDN